MIVAKKEVSQRAFQAKGKRDRLQNIGRAITMKEILFWKDRTRKKERKTERPRDLEEGRERDRALRLSGSEVDYVSYPQSRMNHGSRQSRAIRYVRQLENCPFVLKENLCSRNQNTKRYPST